jgi:hypothetical protein
VPKENNLFQMDVQIAGIEELPQAVEQEAPSNPILENLPIPEEEKKTEIPPIESPKEEFVKDLLQEEGIPLLEKTPDGHPAEEAATASVEDDLSPPEPRVDVSEFSKNEVKEEAPKADVESVPPLEPEPKKQIKAKPPKPKPKKRDRKALMDTIKNAEKKKAKDENRKKLLEMAEKDSMKRKKDDTFDKMLNKSMGSFKRTSEKNKAYGNSSGLGLGMGLGDNESVARVINEQIRPYWSVPSGIKDAEKLIIEVELVFDDIGEVIPSSVKIVDEKRYAMDYIFKAAADSARRAILEVGRFRIPRQKLELEKRYRFRFNVADALRGTGG